jgi:hypothetical protein
MVPALPADHLARPDQLPAISGLETRYSSGFCFYGKLSDFFIPFFIEF